MLLYLFIWRVVRVASRDLTVGPGKHGADAGTAGRAGPGTRRRPAGGGSQPGAGAGNAARDLARAGGGPRRRARPVDAGRRLRVRPPRPLRPRTCSATASRTWAPPTAPTSTASGCRARTSCSRATRSRSARPSSPTRRRDERAGGGRQRRHHPHRARAHQQRGLLPDARRPVHDRRRHGRRRRRRGGLGHVRRGVRRDRPDPNPRRRRAAAGRPHRQRPHPRTRLHRPRGGGHGHHRDRRAGGAGWARRLRERRRQPRLPAARRRPAAAERGPLGGGRAGGKRPDLCGGSGAPSAAKRGHPRARRRGERAGGHLLA